jgi:RimJ/RimL family protein N-acetyltransferase
MEILLTTAEDVPSLLALYESAKAFMHSHGNPTQWRDSGPSEKSLAEDRRAGASYVVKENGRVVGTFALYHADPNYPLITGHWLNEEPYVVLHRVASAQKGVGTFILQSICALYPNVRIDTHKDNAPMKGLLKKMGFVYCGIVPLLKDEGSVREAYMWTRPS